MEIKNMSCLEPMSSEEQKQFNGGFAGIIALACAAIAACYYLGKDGQSGHSHAPIPPNVDGITYAC